MDMSFRLSVPPVTRGVGLSLVTFTFLHAYLGVLGGDANDSTTLSAGLPYLTLVPGLSWYIPWTPLTAALVNRHILPFIVSGLTLFFAGRYFERAWGTFEYTKFVLLLAVGPNILCACVLAIAYLITGSQFALYATINGTAALQAAFLVAFKQLIPEHTIDLFKSAVRVRVKHVPALFVVVYTASSPLTGAFSSTMLVWLGFLLSWAYLRFYRINPSATLDQDEPTAATIGDASDTFAFSHFFPDAVQTLIDPACEAVYQLCLKAKLVAPFSSDAVAAGGQLSRHNAAERGSAGPGSSQKTIEAERRRALALRALEEKLSEVSPSSSNKETPPVTAPIMASAPAPTSGPSTAATSEAAGLGESGKANDYS